MNHIHGGDANFKAKEYGLSLDELIDFSANLNPLGPPAGLNEFIEDNLNLLSHYPSQDSIELRKAIGEHLGVESDRVIAGNGSVELIYLVSKVLPPGSVFIPAPTFSEYEFAINPLDNEIRFLRLREDEGFRPSANTIVREMERIETLFLCNPNNPTGRLLEREDLLKIIDAAREKGMLVIVDEAFVDFDSAAAASTLIEEAGKSDNLFVLRSMTKIFAIPGLRLGYGVGSKSFIEELDKFRPPWNINALAQAVGPELFKEKDFIIQTREFIEEERHFLLGELHKIDGLVPYPSRANFILIKLLGAVTSEDLTQRLGRRGILIRDCSSFRFLDNRFIRVGVRRREENIRLIEALKEVVENIG